MSDDTFSKEAIERECALRGWNVIHGGGGMFDHPSRIVRDKHSDPVYFTVEQRCRSVSYVPVPGKRKIQAVYEDPYKVINYYADSLSRHTTGSMEDFIAGVEAEPRAPLP